MVILSYVYPMHAHVILLITVFVYIRLTLDCIATSGLLINAGKMGV